ncbi:hypothetical protein ABPG75_008653 [Micractinium tetrahymenae]
MRVMQTHRKPKTEPLEGKAVIAPRSLWPDFPLPRGEQGWKGTVGKRKDATHHFVTFPGDSQKYFFLTKDVEKWVVKEPGAAAAAAAAGSSRAAAAAPSSSGGSPTKRGGRPPAEPASPSKATPKASPSKKAKAADESTVVLTRLRDGIDGVLDKFDVKAMQDAYEAVLQVQKKRKL